MSWLKYYEDEQARHPAAHLAKLTEAEARVAIIKLARHFDVPGIDVCFTSGNRSSHAVGSRYIALNRDHLNWLLLAHEFAHCWHVVDRRRRQGKLERSPGWGDGQRDDLNKRFNRIATERAHGKRHARLTDRVVAYITKKGWMAGVIVARETERQERRAARSHAREVAAKSYETRIAKREEQVARLERKIKALTTRARNARRSLTGLRRAQARATEGQSNG